MNNIFAEFKRRNIFRVAGVYAVVAWLLAQIASVLENAMNMPAWFDTMVVSCLLLGFPIAMILAWAFEVTPEGVKRTEAVADGERVTAKTGRVLDYVLVGGLALVGALIIGDRLLPEKASSDAPVAAIDQTDDANGIEGKSIAVLPFEDFSPDKDQAYFADGIAEELLNVLARVEGLRVASRTSAFSFKEREASISEIAAALNVGHILEGSVRKAGDTLRITAQLIDTQTDEHLWSETYDRPLTAENIFAIQDEISHAIVLELNGRMDLLPETVTPLTQSTEAYDAYLRGKEAYRARTEDAINESLDWLGRAVTLDPDFAVAHASLARAYTLQREYAGLGVAHARFRAETHINRALALTPDDSEVLSEDAWQFFGRRLGLSEALAKFDAAIAANPNNASAHRGRGLLLVQYGENDQAMVSFERARELDPQLEILRINMHGVHDDLDDIDSAQSVLLEALELNPEFQLARGGLARLYFVRGDVETAHRIAMSCKGDSYCDGALGNIYASLEMENEVASLGSANWNAFLAFKNGNESAVENFTKEVAAFDALNGLALFDSTTRPAEAYALINENPERFEFLFEETLSPGTDNQRDGLSLYWALHEAGDPRVETLRATLAASFEGVEPGPRNFEEAYINAAKWRMVENDLDGAMAWLNALAEKGVPTTYLQAPSHWFEPLYDRPDYKAFIARMLEIAARDRALIEAQLANPPEVWWSPDEVLGDSNE